MTNDKPNESEACREGVCLDCGIYHTKSAGGIDKNEQCKSCNKKYPLEVYNE